MHRSNRYINHKLTRSTIFQIQHIISEPTYLYSTLSPIQLDLPAHSAAGVRAHSYEIYKASAHTVVEPLSTHQHPWLEITNTSRLISSKGNYIPDPKVHTKNWLLTLEPCSIYTFPWSTDHGQAELFYIIFGRTTLWLESLQF